MEAGPQPLGALMQRLGLANGDLVAASPSQLTHKVVGKARSGRRLTLRAQRKVLDALNRTGAEGTPFRLPDVFNYEGR
jgi:hypothetical protein